MSPRVQCWLHLGSINITFDVAVLMGGVFFVDLVLEGGLKRFDLPDLCCAEWRVPVHSKQWADGFVQLRQLMASEPYAGTADPPGYVDLAAGAEGVWCETPALAHIHFFFLNKNYTVSYIYQNQMKKVKNSFYCFSIPRKPFWFLQSKYISEYNKQGKTWKDSKSINNVTPPAYFLHLVLMNKYIG